MDELVQFKTTSEQKMLLEQWAAEDDRTIAYIMRKLIEAERIRREAKQLPLAALLPEAPKETSKELAEAIV